MHYYGKVYDMNQKNWNNLIKELDEAQEKLRIAMDALQNIANSDFRGNRPHECVMAWKALQLLRGETK